jgi:translation elongation factor P
MRRISDGVKVSERFRTTEQVERAYVEDRPHTFLYNDEEGFHFMNPETYDQIAVSKDVVGDAAPYLIENMSVDVSVHEGVGIAIVLPQRAVFEVVETEPTTKGQTASSSYKPALLSNGVKTTVPPHIATGTHRGDDRRWVVCGTREGLTLILKPIGTAKTRRALYQCGGLMSAKGWFGRVLLSRCQHCKPGTHDDSDCFSVMSAISQ